MLFWFILRDYTRGTLRIYLRPSTTRFNLYNLNYISLVGKNVLIHSVILTSPIHLLSHCHVSLLVLNEIEGCARVFHGLAQVGIWAFHGSSSLIAAPPRTAFHKTPDIAESFACEIGRGIMSPNSIWIKVMTGKYNLNVDWLDSIVSDPSPVWNIMKRHWLEQFWKTSWVGWLGMTVRAISVMTRT